MFCTKCGNPFNGESKFCGKCGTPRAAAPQSEPVQQVSPPPPPFQAQQAVPEQAPPPPPPFQAQQAEPPFQAQQAPPPPPVWQQPGGQPYGAQPYDAQPPGGTQHSFYGAQPPASPPPNSGSNKKLMKILLGVGIPVVAIAVALVVFFVVRPGRGDGASGMFGDLLRANPAAVPIADAFDIMLDEFEQRVETTPLQAIPIMLDNFEDGTLTVNFEYRDRGSWGLGNFSGSAVLRSDTRNNNYALEAALSAMGILNIDMSVFLDSNRLAFGSSLIGDDFYGITFSTFSEDFRTLGNMFGLSQSEINEISDAIDLITEMMGEFSDFGNNAAAFAPYLAVLTNFFRDMEYSSERVTLNIGGQQIEATRISTVVTMREYIDLMEEFINVMADDANIRDMFGRVGGLLGDAGFVYEFDAAINELRNDLRDIGREITGSISESYYIGSNGRLLRAAVTMDVSIDGERTEMYTEMNFGTSADDKWTMETTMIDRWSRTEMSIEWDIRETSGGYENTLSVSTSYITDRWDSVESFTLVSTWSPETGSFSLGFRDDWGFDDSIDGVFNLLPQGFSLRFDDIDIGWNESLSIEIISDRGANIRNINYINISQWEESPFDMIEEILGGLFGGF